MCYFVSTNILYNLLKLDLCVLNIIIIGLFLSEFFNILKTLKDLQLSRRIHFFLFFSLCLMPLTTIFQLYRGS
jgi:hypothetical protein